MKKVSTIVAAAALAAACAAPATSFAQGPARRIYVAPNHSMSAKSMLGAPVYNAQNQKIGSVDTIMVKPGVTEVILSVGDYLGTGPKLVAVPLSHLKLQGSDALEMNATKAMLAKMAAYSIPGG